MKKSLIILSALLISISGFSQIIEGEDGLYYNEKSQLYTGVYTEFYESGQKRIELNLVEGKKDGEVILYFENGSKKEIRKYKMNLMHGTWITWNEQTVKVAEANYNMGNKDGK